MLDNLDIRLWVMEVVMVAFGGAVAWDLCGTTVGLPELSGMSWLDMEM